MLVVVGFWGEGGTEGFEGGVDLCCEGAGCGGGEEVEPGVGEGEDRGGDAVGGHEGELLGDGGEGFGEGPAGEGGGRVGEGALEGGELGFEEDQARVGGGGDYPAILAVILSGSGVQVP